MFSQVEAEQEEMAFTGTNTYGFFFKVKRKKHMYTFADTNINNEHFFKKPSIFKALIEKSGLTKSTCLILI